MKKNIFIIVAVAVLTVCLTIGLVACDDPHVHTFAEDWTNNETSHWHAATCQHTELTTGLAPHVDENDDGKCDVCKRDLGHAHEYSDLWSYDSTHHWHAATCEHSELKSNYGTHIGYETDGICDLCRYIVDPSKAKNFNQEMLASLQGSLHLSGKETYSQIRENSEGGVPTIMEFSYDVTFTPTTYHFLQTSEYENDFELRHFKGNDGFAYQYDFNSATNSYDRVRAGEDENENGVIDESEYFDWSVNPFDSLTVNMFLPATVEGEYKLNVDVETLRDITKVITQWKEDIIEFTVKVSGDKVTSVRFKTDYEEKEQDDHIYLANSSYEFDVVGHGGEVYALVPPTSYAHVTEHDALKTALEELRNLSYTVEHKSYLSKFGEDEDDATTENILFTENCVYVDYRPAPYGYFQNGDTLIKFTNTRGLLQKDNLVDGVDLTEVRAYFPRIEFAVEILEYKGNGVFVAYNAQVARIIASDLDKVEAALAEDAETLQITLGNDGHISEVRYENGAGTVIMRYSKFGSTTIGLDFDSLIDQPDIDDGQSEKYGTFVNEDNTWRIELSIDSLIVNGQTIANYSLSLTSGPDSYWALYFTYEDVEYIAQFTSSQEYDGRAFWYLTTLSGYDVMEALYKVEE